MQHGAKARYAGEGVVGTARAVDPDVGILSLAGGLESRLQALVAGLEKVSQTLAPVNAKLSPAHSSVEGLLGKLMDCNDLLDVAEERLADVSRALHGAGDCAVGEGVAPATGEPSRRG